MKKEGGIDNQAVAVVGMGSLFPLSASVKEYWRLISRGEDAITDVPSTHWSAEDYFRQDSKGGDFTYCKRGGFLSAIDYDPTEFGIPPTILEATDTAQLLSLVVTKMALEDAGYGDTGRAWNRERTGVVLGATGTQELVVPLASRLGFPFWKRALEDAGVPAEVADDVMARISDAYVAWQENSFPGLLGNVIAGRIANRFNLGGTNCVVDAACASSLSAVNLAVLELLSGKSDMMLTGGVDALNDIFMHMCFAKTSVLSFSGDAKPFSKDADGTVLGEGIGIVVLKRLADAEADGDRIYAVIRAMGTSSDGRSAGIYAPVAEGQLRALRRAYNDAGFSPETVALIEAHGTGTRVGDAVEFEALKTFFNESGVEGKDRCAIGSVKSMIGHTKAAAGAASLIKASLALYHKAIPPTLKVTEPDPKINIDQTPFYISTSLRPWLSTKKHPRRAGLSSFGFGGSNFHVVMEEYKAEKETPAWDGSVEIAAFSGDSAADVQAGLKTFTEGVEAHAAKAGGRFAGVRVTAFKTRETFSHAHACRLLMVIERTDDVADLLQKAMAAVTGGDAAAADGKKIFYDTEAGHAGKVAFIFPGQGSQYPYMARDLAVAFPEAHAVFETADIQFANLGAAPDIRLSDRVFPPGLFEKDKKSTEEALRNTDFAQPAIGAASLATNKVLARFGLCPDMTCGHSFGELSALCCAGWMDEETFLSLAAARGKYMAAAGKEKGAMLAIKADLARIEQFIADNGLDLVLANRNSYEQGVLSGREAEIDRAAELCKKDKLRATRLTVAAAFHTELVQDAAKPFKDYLRKKDITCSDIKVFSNVTAQPYPRDPAETRKILGNQLLNPVNFVEEVENMYADGARTFLEVGPKSVLTGLVKSILKGKHFDALATDGSGGRNFGQTDLARVICFFAAQGRPVRLTEWEIPPVQARQQKMSLSICGANYRKEKPARPKRAPMVQKTEPVPVAASGLQTAPASAAPPPGPDTDLVKNALAVVSESLRSMQALQQQTADAHQKFLETQTEAGKALGIVLEKTRSLGQTVMGEDGVVPAVPIKRSAPSAPAVRPEATPPSEPKAAIPAAAPKTPAGQSVDIAAIEAAMLDIVSRVTGYPVEMLGLEMDIENDLGIDSIKRVEILSVFEEEHPDIPSATPEDLAEMRTLKEICDHLVSLSGAVAGTPSAAPASAAARASSADIEAAMLDIVSRVTGYPVEMLGLEMDIENDLGIDSIKRVEILSVFEEEHPDIPSATPEDLAEMRTLKEICDHLVSLFGAMAGTPSAAPASAAARASSADIEAAMLDIVSRVTGYPVEMLGLEMDIENDLGIDSIKRVEILSVFEEEHPDIPSATPEDLAEMRTLKEICDHLMKLGGIQTTPAGDKPAPAVTAEPPEDTADSSGPVLRRVIQMESLPPDSQPPLALAKGKTLFVCTTDASWGRAVVEALMAMDVNAALLENVSPEQDVSNAGGLLILGGLDPAEKQLWHPEDERFVKDAFALAGRVGPVLIDGVKKNQVGIFAAVTFLDGQLGFGRTRAFNPMQAALAGLVKTAAIEWPGVTCRVIDLDPEWTDVKAAAHAVAMEILSAEDPVEVGLSVEGKKGVALAAAPCEPEDLPLKSGDVVVVSGGARGVTAQCALALAKKVRPVLVLLGRSPLPGPEPAWLAGVTSEPEIKKQILENEFSGKTATPAEVDRVFKKHMAGREIAANMEALRAVCTEVVYRSTDVRDDAAVEDLFKAVSEKFGPVRCIVHGAGVLEDRFIIDKTADQFDRVFDTKVAGAKALVLAADMKALRCLVFFSSVSARMGNKGQADYAMANEVLNKTAQLMALQNQGCRVISFNWGPWDGGMVTASLKREFEKSRVALIPLAAGARCMVEEMASPAGDVEVVIGAGFDDVGKATPETSPAPAPAKKEVENTGPLFEAFTRKVDVEEFPVLKSHLLDGRPVVPFALAAEWVGSGALHANPGLMLIGIDDMRVLSGIKVDETGRTVTVLAGKPIKSGTAFEVAVQIKSDSSGKETVHYGARAVLAAAYETPPVFTEPASLASSGYTRTAAELYDTVLFHGKALHGLQEVVACSTEGIKATISSAPSPKQWIRRPVRNTWLADPLALDTAFQMAIVWCHEQAGMVCLPVSFKSFRQYRTAFPAEGVTAVLAVTNRTSRKMRGDVFFLDENGAMVACMTGFEAVMDKSLGAAFKS
ncbi:type I polyketide synthase [Desulfosudis oleivorans]|uniref:Polyketide-type polyunsaturated fatty acid synthase, PfaA n=1 Tax=Desulfosudis oleivorans (strain DSM 6200 / JCM 39069 / Hxd3) TaxID=96561 RepID=A9A0I0_DESOH|nr:type I polyketide synthase [Desulfosudis oleivorans]ABW67480.1 Polyketide-type polyunsaturated fatty acid synthase, PfaA [Desulfosudis oleivorans Hxd3]